MVPGKPLYFATAMPLAGVATGILVESHEGRPTKIEGNPGHPASLGATDLLIQASVLGLYDPDRSQAVTYRGQPRAWNEALSAKVGFPGRSTCSSRVVSVVRKKVSLAMAMLIGPLSA